MRNTDFLRRNRLVCWLILSLGCLASCEDTAEPATRPDRPSSPETDEEDEDGDESADTADTDEMTSTDAKPDAKASSTSRDASPATGSRNDAGLDAASAKPDAALPEDASSSDAAIDGGVAPTRNEDAGPQKVDASTSSRDAATDSQDAQAPTATPAHSFKVDSKDEWTASDFQVKAGSCYTVTAKIDDKWLDLDVPADLSGWKNKNDSRLALFAPLRRVAQKDIGFYQFATCVDKKFDHCFPIGETSTVCPKASGELFFFVNDVKGFESNNVGTASVTIQAK